MELGVPIHFMEKFATVTPHRGGERPQFMDMCLLQLGRMGFDETILVNHKPHGNVFDLVPRIKLGIETAKAMGIDRVAIVEDDDFYQADYLQHINLDDYDFFGWGSTYYYNLRNRSWQRSYHQDTHSSLFCTAFRISALEGFRWPPDTHVWLDIELWKFARHNRRFFLSQEEPPCIGIKHGIGKVGGKAHGFDMKNKDPDLSWLKSKVDDDAFRFYSNLKF